MAKETLSRTMMNEIFATTHHLVRFPQFKKMWIDYDKEADVLYLSIERPQDATDSEMLDNGILLRYRGERLVGITIFEASKR